MTNTELIKLLTAHLNTLDYIGSVWLEGSFARGEEDEFADIDLYVDCVDDKVDECKENISAYLQSISIKSYKIAHNYFQNHPQLMQYYISVDGVILDLMIQSSSRTKEIIFSKDEEVKIIYDKPNQLRFSEELCENTYINIDRKKLSAYIDIKCDVIIQKAKRGDFVAMFTKYIDVVEDYFDFILSKNPLEPKSYSTFRNISLVDESGKYKKLLTPQSCEEIITNLIQIQTKISLE